MRYKETHNQIGYVYISNISSPGIIIKLYKWEVDNTTKTEFLVIFRVFIMWKIINHLVINMRTVIEFITADVILKRADYWQISKLFV